MPEKTYQVKSIFGPTVQGEGMHAGLPCLFLRLAGCNAWDGRPATRAQSACPYCDTDFLGGEALDLTTILMRLQALRTLPGGNGIPDAPATLALGLVLSGGEPLLQADEPLLAALGSAFPWVDIETNGTRVCPPRPSTVFVSCSPKRIKGAKIRVHPDWWKVLIPDQESFLDLALASGKPVFVQPTCPDSGPQGPVYEKHVEHCLHLCYGRGCRISLQLHKFLNIP